MEKIQTAVKTLREKGYLVSPETIDHLKQEENPEELAKKINEKTPESKAIIEPEDLKKKKRKQIEVKGSLEDFKSKQHEAEIEILKKDISKESTSKGEVEDFVENFKSRHRKIHKILRNRGENSAVDIERAKDKEEDMKIIGLITEKKTTKNGHVFMRLEDPTGLMKALVPNNQKELIEETNELVNDEVIAVEGHMGNNNLFIINNIHCPDLPVRELKTTEEDIAIVTTSDLHIGSKYFLEKNFEAFIEWLRGERGNERQRELAKKVKYLTIAGDLVDGVGVYPEQEKELTLTDIYQQYKQFKKYVEQIPDHIQIIIGPGNHDAVNKADPQPKIPPELIEGLEELPNIIMVGSPAVVKLHGLKFLMYHGTSFDDIIPQIKSASYENIKGVLKKTLKARHLHPIYGEKPVTPEREDHLVIEEAPDIYHTGHVHKNGYDKYRGTLCVNSGTWQEKTPYQKKIGHKPTPGKLPVIETKTGKINVLRFDQGINEEGVRENGEIK